MSTKHGRIAHLRVPALGILAVAAISTLTGCRNGRASEEPVVETISEFASPSDSSITIEDDIWFGLRSLPREHLARAAERLARNEPAGAAADLRSTAALLRLDAKKARTDTRSLLRESAGALDRLATDIEGGRDVPKADIMRESRMAYYALGSHDLHQARGAWAASNEVLARALLLESIEQIRAGYTAGGGKVPEDVKPVLDHAQESVETTVTATGAEAGRAFDRAADEIVRALAEFHTTLTENEVASS